MVFASFPSMGTRQQRDRIRECLDPNPTWLATLLAASMVIVCSGRCAVRHVCHALPECAPGVTLPRATTCRRRPV